MLFIPPSNGPTLNAHQVKSLDDEFFTARPLAYFSARIESLLNGPATDAGDGPSAAFLATLGLPQSEGLLTPTDSDRSLQVGLDALSSRHHAAESLVRLIHALTMPRIGSEGQSTWAALADGPPGLHTVVTDIRNRLDAAPDRFSELFLKQGLPDTENTRLAFDLAVAWVQRAMLLVTDNDLTVNAAYNKIKHGLAVRVRDDRRVELVPGDGVDITANDTVPVSAFENSIPIIDKPEVAYLVRPFARPTQGLEVDSLLLDAPVILAETWMIAVVHAAIFHNAAVSHFKGRDEDLAPYPRLHTGPMPAQVTEQRVQGFREVITTPPEASTIARQSGLFHSGNFIPMQVDFASERTVTVTEQ